LKATVCAARASAMARASALDSRPYESIFSAALGEDALLDVFDALSARAAAWFERDFRHEI
jgi:hypothetical protein